jgi:hypothetical protein
MKAPEEAFTLLDFLNEYKFCCQHLSNLASLDFSSIFEAREEEKTIFKLKDVK